MESDFPMKSIISRFTVILTALAATLALSGFVLAHTRLAQASVPAQVGWQRQHIDHQVTFSYPNTFVPANDGGPYLSLVGGALLNANHTAYELLLGVALDTHPQISVAHVRKQLLRLYRADTLLLDRSTPFGQELSFAMPDHMTYTLYLAPTRRGVREIIINNEHSNPAYHLLITTFLSTVHNT